MREIVTPVTKPESEWIDGRVVRKVSPTRRHGKLQLLAADILMRWGGAAGETASEWRFGVPFEGERRTLVPDVAYLSFERSRALTDAEVEYPPVAPDIAVEILSPDDRPARIESKLRVLLGAGTRLAIVIDPGVRTVTLRSAVDAVTFVEGETARHRVAPDLEIDVRALFAAADRRDRPSASV